MLSMAPAAVVEPKEKSQNPGAKSKRMKRLRSNPDFAEAVSEERAAARMWEDRHADLHRKYKVVGFQVNKLAAKCRKWRKCGKRTKRLQSAQMAVIAEMAQSAQIWRKCRN